MLVEVAVGAEGGAAVVFSGAGPGAQPMTFKAIFVMTLAVVGASLALADAKSPPADCTGFDPQKDAPLRSS